MQTTKKSMMAMQWLAGDGAVVAAGRHLLELSPSLLLFSRDTVMCSVAGGGAEVGRMPCKRVKYGF